MTRDEKIDRLKPYVRKMADLLCLKDWRIEVALDTPDRKHHTADIQTITGKKDARIRVEQDFFDKDENEQRQSICHELIHLHISQMDDFLRNILTSDQETTYNLIRELAVDEIAQAVAPHMPPVEVDSCGSGEKST